MKMGIRWPDSARKWVCFGLVFGVIVIGVWPVIPLFNSDTIIFGMPVLMVWSVVIVILTTAVMAACNLIMKGEKE